MIDTSLGCYVGSIWLRVLQTARERPKKNCQTQKVQRLSNHIKMDILRKRDNFHMWPLIDLNIMMLMFWFLYEYEDDIDDIV